MRLTLGKSKVALNNSISFFLVVIIYRLLLDKCYFSIVTEQFSYEGLKDNRETYLLIISWICLIISLFFVRKIAIDKSSRISNIVVLSLYIMSFVPFTTCIYAGILEYGFIVYNFLYWIVLLIFQSYLCRKPVYPFERISFGKIVLNDKIVMVIGFLSLLLVLFISAVYTHFRINLNLFSVYELRAEALTYSMPTAISYAFSWTRAINPVLLGYCIEKKKRLATILFLFTQLLSFGIDGLKSTFFMIIIVVLCVVVCKYVNFSNIKMYTSVGITAITAFSIIEHLIFKTSFTVTIFIRRMMFIPNYLGECYYDFFKTNPHDYFRGSFLRYFGAVSPYQDQGSISLAIGTRYFRYGANCNDGLAADAMTNLSLAGIILMPILLCLVLKLLDRSSININNCIILIVSFYTAEIIIGTFLATALITHGLLIIILLTAMMDRSDNGTVINRKASKK